MKILLNYDVTSLYPNLVRIYGYSSRNQQDKEEYIKLLKMRIQAKHNELDKGFLDSLDLENEDLKTGLKLPINSYTGGLRAKFNDLYDPLQGYSICITGQLLILQLVYDLQTIPTLEMVSANTDAVEFLIEEEYKSQAKKVLDDWQSLTGLELEEDKIIKLVARDVNNYCEIVELGENNYKVGYKGGAFSGNHIFKWDKENKIFRYSFKKDLKSNSLTIIGEALLKKLLFNIPIKDTINKCDDIFRFQMIAHLGSTYEKVVQEKNNNYIDLPQRNNRIYAGHKKSGCIYKVKKNNDGTLRYDRLANCPSNPIIDNDNKCTINDIDRDWYIDYANQMVEDFLGTGKQLLKERKKNMKKDELIEENSKLQERIKELEKDLATNSSVVMTSDALNVSVDNIIPANVKLLRKIDKLRKEITNYEFTLDQALSSNLGGKEYISIGQYYRAIQELCIKVGLDFSFETLEETRFERDIIKPATGSPKHLSTVKCVATLTDIDTGCFKKYMTMASGSDTIDKGVSSAETLAFRKWFTFNFTPHIPFEWETEDNIPVEETSNNVKIPTYLPPEKKEEVKVKVVSEKQQEDTDKEDIDFIVDSIYRIRAIKQDDNYGAKTLKDIQENDVDSATILSYKLSIQNRLKELGVE